MNKLTPKEKLQAIEESLAPVEDALRMAIGMIPDDDWNEDVPQSKAAWIAQVLRQLSRARDVAKSA